jgi:hypothetical protein
MHVKRARRISFLDRNLGIVITVVVLGIIFGMVYGSGVDILGKKDATGRSVTTFASCSDSDGGKDIFTAGSCYSVPGGGHSDSCSSGKVREYYCGGGSCTYDDISCPTGETCSGGECKCKSGYCITNKIESGCSQLSCPENCVETDNGNDLLNKGTCSMLGEPVKTDSCSGTQSVLEYFCQKTSGFYSCVNATSACPSGTHCDNAVCVADPYGGSGDETAVYDSALGAPKCISGNSKCIAPSRELQCGNIQESNQPNTLDSCTDLALTSGYLGVQQCHSPYINGYNSVDNITIEAVNDNKFAKGKTVNVKVGLYCFDTSKYLNLFYTSNAQSPSWQLVESRATCSSAGFRTETFTVMLANAVGFHAIRAVASSHTSPTSACYSDDQDKDDLAFYVVAGCTDNDGDGHYAIGSACSPADDCNDNDKRIFPGNPEICTDNLDNDCDSAPDCSDSDCANFVSPQPCYDFNEDGVVNGTEATMVALAYPGQGGTYQPKYDLNRDGSISVGDQMLLAINYGYCGKTCAQSSCSALTCGNCGNYSLCKFAGCNWCANGCQQSACGTWCQDSDNGNIYVKGTCKDYLGQAIDSCNPSDTRVAWEYSCSGLSYCTHSSGQCPVNQICSDGACACNVSTCAINGNIANGCNAAACIKPCPCDSYGDVDLDGYVSLSDSMLIASFVAGSTTLTNEQKRRADVNGDGAVSMVDSSLISQYSSGLINTFNVCSVQSCTVSSDCGQNTCSGNIFTQPICSGGNCQNKIANCGQQSKCANNVLTTPTCSVTTGCSNTSSDCPYGCNATTNNKCSLPCSSTSQCGQTTCTGSTLTQPTCTGGICGINASTCQYNCNLTYNKCNLPPVVGACSDTDSADDPYTAGSCTNNTAEYRDTCSGNSLTQYFCSGNSCIVKPSVCDVSKNLNCSIDKCVCAQGACWNNPDDKTQGCSAAACGIPQPTEDISLVQPWTGVSPTSTFTIIVNTTFNAECRYITDEVSTDYINMYVMSTTNNREHRVDNYEITDDNIHLLDVKCKNLSSPFWSILEHIREVWVDSTPPYFIIAEAVPDVISDMPLQTNLTVATDDDSFCKYGNQPDYYAMQNSITEGSDYEYMDYTTYHEKTITGLTNPQNYTYFIACKNLAGLISTATVSFRVNTGEIPSVSITYPENNGAYSNQTMRIEAETNRNGRCSYGPTSSAGVISGTFNTLTTQHTSADFTLPAGSYTYYVKCDFSTALGPRTASAQTNFIIDITPPSTPIVNDTDPRSGDTQTTGFTDRLTVQFYSQDTESGIKEYSYAIFRFDDNSTVKNWTFTTNAQIEVGSLSLINNTRYYFKAKAHNRAGLESNIGVSDGITVLVTAQPNTVTCSNGIKDGMETDIDCGGICAECSNGKNCFGSMDCSSGYCDANKICRASVCDDGIQNGDETDIDCGGSCSETCGVNDNCEVDSDCTSDICTGGKCKSGSSSGGGTTTNDADGDGIPDISDNCPANVNENQKDTDFDGMGDICDADADGDGIPNDWELQHNLDPLNPSDANNILEGGLTALQQYLEESGQGEGIDTEVTGGEGGGFFDWLPFVIAGVVLVFLLVLVLLLVGGRKPKEPAKITHAPSAPIHQYHTPSTQIPVPRTTQGYGHGMMLHKRPGIEQRKEIFSEFEGTMRPPLIMPRTEPPKQTPRTAIPEKKTEEDADALRRLAKTTTEKEPEEKSEEKEKNPFKEISMYFKESRGSVISEKKFSTAASKIQTKAEIVSSIRDLSRDKTVSRNVPKQILTKLLISKKLAKRDAAEVVSKLKKEKVIDADDAIKILSEVTRRE